MEREITVSEVESLIEDFWNEKLDPESQEAELVQQFLSPKGFSVTVELCDEMGRSKRRDYPISKFNPDTDEIRIYFGRAEESEPFKFDESEMDNAIDSLVECLDKVESEGMPFVSLKWFRDTLLPKKRFAWALNSTSRQTVLAEAISRGLISTSKVDNPVRPEFPTTAIKVVKELEEVK